MKFNTMISTGDGEEVLCIQDKKDIYICSRDHLDFSRQVEEVYDGSENEEEIIDKLIDNLKRGDKVEILEWLLCLPKESFIKISKSISK